LFGEGRLMRGTVLGLVLLVLSPAGAHAQPRPGAFSTLTTSDTSVVSICVGASAIPASGGTCTGGITAGAAAFTQLTNVFLDQALGTHEFAASGVGANVLLVSDATAGTANFAALSAQSDSGALNLYAFSSTYTTSGYAVAAGEALLANGTGGLSIDASNVAGVVRIYTGSTLQAAFYADGGISFSAGGGLTDTATTVVINGPIVVGGEATLNSELFLGQSGYIDLSSTNAATLTIVGLKSTTGTRYLCISTLGVVTSATSCTGT
jgi:hypothetical protein